ncbi:MAG TPA: flagellar hook-basal body complex protein [Chloroflexi bacterium]|jgi:flagellar basal-body rod protein FlgG|nr:flagellar hook-basal body complex protein [Chloroflexota bacterium]
MITALASSYKLAASGMRANQIHLDVVSNNIANANTPGFKSSHAYFAEALDSAAGGPDALDARRYLGVRVANTSPNLAQGTLAPSDAPWHMAIDGAGYFQIRLPDGTPAYTRDGRFALDARRRLVTVDGYLLEPAVTLPEGAQEAHVNPDGTIMAEFADEQGGRERREVGRITVMGFIVPERLQHIGKNLFAATPESGAAMPQRPDGQPWGEIVAQAVEGSNTELADAMMDLVSAQRAYAVSARVLQTYDEMAAEAANLKR